MRTRNGSPTHTATEQQTWMRAAHPGCLWEDPLIPGKTEEAWPPPSLPVPFFTFLPESCLPLRLQLRFRPLPCYSLSGQPRTSSLPSKFLLSDVKFLVEGQQEDFKQKTEYFKLSIVSKCKFPLSP